MSKIDDGGSAFPVVYQHEFSDGCRESSQAFGMSLRDWFAGQALTGLLGSFEPSADGEPLFIEEAITCYVWADAMLAARNKEKS